MLLAASLYAIISCFRSMASRNMLYFTRLVEYNRSH